MPFNESISLSSLNAGFKDSDKFFDFLKHKAELRISPEPMLPVDEPRPPASFSQLFETDLHLVNEVIPGLWSLCFAVIPVGRCSRTKKLPGNVVSSSGTWEFFRNVNNNHSEVHQPIL